MSLSRAHRWVGVSIVTFIYLKKKEDSNNHLHQLSMITWYSILVCFLVSGFPPCSTTHVVGPSYPNITFNTDHTSSQRKDLLVFSLCVTTYLHETIYLTQLTGFKYFKTQHCIKLLTPVQWLHTRVFFLRKDWKLYSSQTVETNHFITSRLVAGLVWLGENV